MLKLTAYKHLLGMETDSGPAGHVAYAAEIQGAQYFADDIRVRDNRVTAELPGIRIHDEFQAAVEDRIIIRRRWEFTADLSVGLTFCWELPITSQFWMTPAVIYGGNPFGEGKFPKGTVADNWSFREDRIPVPNMSYVWSQGRFGALFSDPAPAPDLIGSVRTFEHLDSTIFEIRIPYRESPFRHNRKWYRRQMAPAVQKDLTVSAGEELERTFFLASGSGDFHSYSKVLHWAWEVIPNEKPRPAADWGRIARLKTLHLHRNFFIQRKSSAGYVTTLARGMVPLGNFLSGGFVGKNIEIACSLYRLGREAGMESLWSKALDVAEFFQRARLQNGLFYGDYSLFRRRWKGSFFHKTGISTRVMGEMALQYLNLYDAARRFGDADREWYFTARSLCQFFVERQLPNGSYGKWWSPFGTLLEDSGTGGAYLIRVMARMFKSEKDESYLNSAIAAADYHIRSHVDRDMYWGDALDSNCIDREGGHSIICALLDLFDATGDEAYLEAAIKAAEYLLSWTFCWDVPLPPESPLGKRGFRTRGGTSVSIAHHHLDPYGIAIAVAFLRLAAAVGDMRWRDYALEMMDYSAQLVAREGDMLGFSSIWEGYQPEQVNQTDWDYLSPRIFGRGTAKNIIAWVPALTLGAIMELRDLFPDLVDFSMAPFPVSGGLRLWLGKKILRILSCLNPIS